MGLVLSGCGGARVSTFKAPTRVTLTKAQTGSEIVCRKGQNSVTGIVPAPGHAHGWVNGLDLLGVSVALTRHADGSLAVNCS